jgi:hypothetical protein
VPSASSAVTPWSSWLSPTSSQPRRISTPSSVACSVSRRSEEPLQQTALVHHLDAARVQAERADIPGRLRLLLQHERVHAVQPQLAGQHHAGRSAAGNDHVNHEIPPFNKVAFRPAAPRKSGGAHTGPPRRVRNRSASPTGGSTSRETHTSTRAHVLRESLISAGSGFGREILQHDPGLAASPPVRYKLGVARSAQLLAFFFCRPLWTDNLLARRQRAAYGGPSIQKDLPCTARRLTAGTYRARRAAAAPPSAACQRCCWCRLGQASPIARAGATGGQVRHSTNGWGRRFDSGGELHTHSDQRKRWSVVVLWPVVRARCSRDVT